MNNTYLAHYGVLGMKWGVRRYQNKDGTLTAAGRKRVHDAYTKEMKRADSDLVKNYNELYVNAYNKTVDIVNPKLHKFNEDWEKKHGSNSFEDPEYERSWNEIYDKIFSEQYNSVVKDFVNNNPHFIKAHDLVEQYKMQEWSDDVAKDYKHIKELFDK